MDKRKKTSLAWDQIYLNMCYKHRAIKEVSSAKKKLKVVNGGYKGTDEEFQKVKAFWKPYGITPKKFWYQLYGYGKNGFDPRYIPDDMWFSKILPYFNNQMWGRAFADKCGYDRLFPHLNRPRTIVMNSCGRYYDSQLNIITKEEAMALCLKEHRFIAKFATFSCGGKSIEVFEDGEVTQESVKRLFEEYQMNFVIQELVEQSQEMARLNASSLNTIRIISFFFKGKTYILSSILRIGGDGARVDNYSSGGYSVNVLPSGQLNDWALNKAKGMVTTHPNGYAFKDIKISSYDKIVSIIRREAARLPQISIIGWDFAVDQNEEPIFIEMNVFPGQNQRGSGPAFGDLTEEVLQDVFIDKTLKDAFA